MFNYHVIIDYYQNNCLYFLRIRVCGGRTRGLEEQQVDGQHKEPGEAVEAESGTQITAHPPKRLWPLVGPVLLKLWSDTVCKMNRGTVRISHFARTLK